MTPFTSLSQELKTLESHKASSLRDTSFHIQTIHPDTTHGETSISARTLMFIIEFSELSTVMNSQEDSSPTKVLLLMLLKAILLIFSLKPEL